MRRRTLLAGATAAAGLTALGTALPSARPALADTGGGSGGGDRTVPRVLAEPSASHGLVRPDLRFDMVAVTGDPGETDAAVRFETADGLGSWNPVHLHTGGRDDRDPVAAALVRAPEGATGYEVRSRGESAAVNLHDGEVLRFGGPAQASLSAEASGVTRGRTSVPFRTRAGWGADESWRFDDLGNDLWAAEFHPVQALTVHHTAMPTGDDHAADVRAVYYLHAVQQAWGDIGYHVLIDPDGVVYEGRHSGGDGVPVFSGVPRPGRAESVTAGHAYGFNQGNVGVCLLGDFTDELPTQAAQDSLVDVLRVLCAVTGVDPAGRIEYVNPGTGVVTPGDAISRHRDWLETECPGNAFSEVFDSAVRQRVIAGLA
ncbi:peptidoglycan recognition family protein [Nocardiopsis sp. HUAS JQ3]|uniref:peptidoglycan recognition protein family protein n=1 Tax=Nocardiopsis sp. HUAS JQ3 TaxID=3061629 RepID=UPI0023A9D5F4|nr:N-acetylmuramoyl-L-alanine amidase [Nocardiopsis sp. HUAS JQ3]WDZ89560.1 N-acetylmuramoyl-L-alanine amidase [Nocardiopsis sp. HUAS JQ3]